LKSGSATEEHFIESMLLLSSFISPGSAEALVRRDGTVPINCLRSR